MISISASFVDDVCLSLVSVLPFPNSCSFSLNSESRLQIKSEMIPGTYAAGSVVISSEFFPKESV